MIRRFNLAKRPQFSKWDYDKIVYYCGICTYKTVLKKDLKQHKEEDHSY